MLERILKIGLLLCLAASVSLAQKDKDKEPKPLPKAKPEPAEKTKPPAYPEPPRHYPNEERFTTERAIAADPNVAIKLCISEGAVKINGWERNEVRVFVHNGRKFEFRSLEKNADTGKANWLWIANASETAPRRGPKSDCLSGDSVEIDLPMSGSVMLEARTAGAVIDSVKKVSVKIVEGSISLRNISGGISATALQGDVMVEGSSGVIALDTTTGNILAFDIKPGDVSDLFKAKTNSGQISLQGVYHRQLEANSISGSVGYKGKILAGGIYNFKTSNGSISMLLPEATSCKLVASYGFGSFESAIPYKLENEIDSQGGKSIIAKFGTGAATINVTTSSGSIGIRKQN